MTKQELIVGEQEVPSGTHLVYGFRRDDYSDVSMLIDQAEFDPFNSVHKIAERIAGDAYRFHAATCLFVTVPDDAKNIIFHSDEERYAKVPALRRRR